MDFLSTADTGPTPLVNSNLIVDNNYSHYLDITTFFFVVTGINLLMGHSEKRITYCAIQLTDDKFCSIKHVRRGRRILPVAAITWHHVTCDTDSPDRLS